MINKNEIYKNLFGQDTSMFDHIEDNNINEVYNNNLTLWYINNSDIKPTTKDGKGIEIENHKILNLDNVNLSKTKRGRELTEIDFIDDQLIKLSKMNFDALNIINKKNYKIYKSYLLEKQNQPQKVESIKTDEVKPTFSFTNNFDNIEETKVLEYFFNKLVVPKFIDKSTLHDFLLIAFDKKEIPKKLFSFNKLNTKRQIRKIFYDYYNVIAGKPHGKQTKYVELLANYFEGFDTKSIKTNFNK
jgi:hypothetical protein